MPTIKQLYDLLNANPKPKILCYHGHDALGAGDQSLELFYNDKEYPNAVLVACDACKNKWWRSTPYELLTTPLPELPGWFVVSGTFLEEVP